MKKFIDNKKNVVLQIMLPKLRPDSENQRYDAVILNFNHSLLYNI